MNRPPDSIDEYLRRYERTCAAIIAFSLGYATPQCDANILRDAYGRSKNYCEWIYECYRADPLPAVKSAIRSRHRRTKYMSEYEAELAMFHHANLSAEHQTFAAWFYTATTL